METLSNQDIAAAGLTDWRKLAQALHARFRCADLPAAGAFVAAVAGAAGDGEPEIRVGTGFVDVSVCTRVDGLWLTAADLVLAQRISEIAADLGLTPDPGAVTQVELGLDTAHHEELAPFWAALLTGGSGNVVHGEVIDATNRVPNLWFQATNEHDVPRQRWHLDVWVAAEVAGQRIAAAVAAGGTMVDDSEAPAFTLLADPDGNRVCVCTSLGRG